jgi:hypothetical protein
MDTATYAAAAVLPWSVAQSTKRPIRSEADLAPSNLSYITRWWIRLFQATGDWVWLFAKRKLRLRITEPRCDGSGFWPNRKNASPPNVNLEDTNILEWILLIVCAERVGTAACAIPADLPGIAVPNYNP